MTDEHRDAADLIREMLHAEENHFELPSPAVVEIAESPFGDPPGWEMPDCTKCAGTGWVLSSRDGHNWVGCPKCLRGGIEYDSIPMSGEAEREAWKEERRLAREASKRANSALQQGKRPPSA